MVVQAVAAQQFQETPGRRTGSGRGWPCPGLAWNRSPRHSSRTCPAPGFRVDRPAIAQAGGPMACMRSMSNSTRVAALAARQAQGVGQGAESVPPARGPTRALGRDGQGIAFRPGGARSCPLSRLARGLFLLPWWAGPVSPGTAVLSRCTVSWAAVRTVPDILRGRRSGR